jgi:hypothetical protein
MFMRKLRDTLKKAVGMGTLYIRVPIGELGQGPFSRTFE